MLGSSASHDHAPLPFIDLLDWRRRVVELYGDVRSREDSEAAWLLWRNGRDRLFQTHGQSPLPAEARAVFAGLPFFDYDPRLRLSARLAPLSNVDPFDIPVGGDGTVSLQPFAVTEGLAPVIGRELTVYWLGGYGGGVFLPFKDGSAGQSTYGGGRYVLDSIKGADLGLSPDGRMCVDFNFAYNPSCAYSDRWVCPLAPVANHLGVTIEAGEKHPDALLSRSAA